MAKSVKGGVAAKFVLHSRKYMTPATLCHLTVTPEPALETLSICRTDSELVGSVRQHHSCQLFRPSRSESR